MKCKFLCRKTIIFVVLFLVGPSIFWFFMSKSIKITKDTMSDMCINELNKIENDTERMYAIKKAYIEFREYEHIIDACKLLLKKDDLKNNIKKECMMLLCHTYIDVSSIKEVKADFFKGEEELIGVEFVFTLDYNPDIAIIELKGNLIIALEPKLAKDILKQWEEKKILSDFKLDLFNIILRRSTLKCLQLEDEISLPLHVRLPTLTISEKKESGK